MFISGRVSRCGGEAHVVIGAHRPGSTWVALDNALSEVTRHLGIALLWLLAHVATRSAVHEP